MIANKTFFKLVGEILAPELESQGFRLLEGCPGFFYRQRGPFSDQVWVGMKRTGDYARLATSLWVPWLEAEPVDVSNISVKDLGIMVGGEVSPKRVRDSWGWDMRDEAHAVSSFREMVSSLREVVTPWFEAVKSAEDFAREAQLNPMFWRGVNRDRRTEILRAIESALRTGAQEYVFAAKRSDRAKVTQSKPKDESAGEYQAVRFEHSNPEIPGVKLTIEGVSKKR